MAIEEQGEETGALPDITEARLWRQRGWTARIIKNPDDDGWAVEMKRVGDQEASLVGPWTMGRDKKNPKPLDLSAFNTLVKTAQDFLARAENNRRAQLHKNLSYTREDGTRIRADLDIVPDEDDPHAILTCITEPTMERLYKGRVAPNFRLTLAAVERQMRGGSDD